MWRSVKHIIQEHNNFLLTTHVNPDGDGVGAACALTELLIKQDKRVCFVCDSPIPQKLTFLNFRNNHAIYDPSVSYDDVEVVILLDTHRKDRIGAVANIIDHSRVVVCIDHHRAAESFTKYSVIEPNACSVGAMIYTLFKEMGFDLNLWAATGIYTSVICDTGRFSYSSTSRKAHKIADECIKLGVDPDEMHSRLFQHISLAQIKMFAQALNGMETYLDNRVIVEQISQSDYEKDWPDLEHVDLEYIHEFNKHIENIECVVLLRELGDHEVRVSLRSVGDLDVGVVLHNFGGGGHRQAAGATCKGSLQEVKSKVLDALKQALAQPKCENLPLLEPETLQ